LNVSPVSAEYFFKKEVSNQLIGRRPFCCTKGQIKLKIRLKSASQVAAVGEEEFFERN
jgi:hypothetical protein